MKNFVFMISELREDSYVFGRGTEKDGVNITFDLLAVGKKNAQVISKKHFKIVRVKKKFAEKNCENFC